MPGDSTRMSSCARSVMSVFLKDWRSELRTRYAMNALLMFVVTTIAIVLFSLGSEGAPSDALSGMLWTVIFFSAMSGLSRTFVMEEERGTTFTLQLLAPPSAVFFGKLLFNLVLVHTNPFDIPGRRSSRKPRLCGGGHRHCCHYCQGQHEGNPLSRPVVSCITPPAVDRDQRNAAGVGGSLFSGSVW